MADTFVCARCSGEFEKAVSDEAQQEEYEREFPIEASVDAPRDTVCDDCYKAFMAWFDPNRPVAE